MDRLQLRKLDTPQNRLKSHLAITTASQAEHAMYIASDPRWATTTASQAGYAFASLRTPRGPSRQLRKLVRHVRRFGPHVGRRDSYASKLRQVRRFRPIVGHRDNFASKSCHVRRFRPHVGHPATLYSEYASREEGEMAARPGCCGERGVGHAALAREHTQPRGPTPPEVKKRKRESHSHLFLPILAYRYITFR